MLEDTSPRSGLSSWAERIAYVSEAVLRKVAGVDSTQGLHGVGVLALPSSFCNLEGGGDIPVDWVCSPRRVLVLDGIQVSVAFVHFGHYYPSRLFWSSFIISRVEPGSCSLTGILTSEFCRGHATNFYKKIGIQQ